MNRIIVAGLVNDKNLGDRIIADSVDFLLNESLSNQNIEIQKLDLAEFDFIEKQKNKIVLIFDKIFNKVRSIFDLSIIVYRKKYINYYEPQVYGAKAILIAGGGMIKYKKQKCWLYINCLIGLAEKHNIPVFLNAVGVEGFDQNNKKCQILKNALNKPIVKSISTRDDFQTLRNKYLEGNNQIAISKVADPAVFSSDVYQIKRNENSKIIGVGLIRGEIFEDYNINFSKAELTNLYVGVLNELTLGGYEWELFTNGHPSDLSLAESILSEVKNTQKIKNVKVPVSSNDLVEIISDYQAVIAVRLHACIISYSLEIPVVGLVWNNKLSFFGESIGYPERFIRHQDFSPDLILNRLKMAIEEGYDITNMKNYKGTIKISIKEMFIKNFTQ